MLVISHERYIQGGSALFDVVCMRLSDDTKTWDMHTKQTVMTSLSLDKPYMWR